MSLMESSLGTMGKVNALGPLYYALGFFAGPSHSGPDETSPQAMADDLCPPLAAAIAALKHCRTPPPVEEARAVVPRVLVADVITPFLPPGAVAGIGARTTTAVHSITVSSKCSDIAAATDVALRSVCLEEMTLLLDAEWLQEFATIVRCAGWRTLSLRRWEHAKWGLRHEVDRLLRARPATLRHDLLDLRSRAEAFVASLYKDTAAAFCPSKGTPHPLRPMVVHNTVLSALPPAAVKEWCPLAVGDDGDEPAYPAPQFATSLRLHRLTRIDILCRFLPLLRQCHVEALSLQGPLPIAHATALVGLVPSVRALNLSVTRFPWPAYLRVFLPSRTELEEVLRHRGLHPAFSAFVSAAKGDASQDHTELAAAWPKLSGLLHDTERTYIGSKTRVEPGRRWVEWEQVPMPARVFCDAEAVQGPQGVDAEEALWEQRLAASTDHGTAHGGGAADDDVDGADPLAARGALDGDVFATLGASFAPPPLESLDVSFSKAAAQRPSGFVPPWGCPLLSLPVPWVQNLLAVTLPALDHCIPLRRAPGLLELTLMSGSPGMLLDFAASCPSVSRLRIDKTVSLEWEPWAYQPWPPTLTRFICASPKYLGPRGAKAAWVPSSQVEVISDTAAAPSVHIAEPVLPAQAQGVVEVTELHRADTHRHAPYITLTQHTQRVAAKRTRGATTGFGSNCAVVLDSLVFPPDDGRVVHCGPMAHLSLPPAGSFSTVILHVEDTAANIPGRAHRYEWAGRVSEAQLRSVRRLFIRGEWDQRCPSVAQFIASCPELATLCTRSMTFTERDVQQFPRTLQALSITHTGHHRGVTEQSVRDLFIASRWPHLRALRYGDYGVAGLRTSVLVDPDCV